MHVGNHKGATAARVLLQLSLRVKTVMKSSKGLINLLNE